MEWKIHIWKIISCVKFCWYIWNWSIFIRKMPCEIFVRNALVVMWVPSLVMLERWKRISRRKVECCPGGDERAANEVRELRNLRRYWFTFQAKAFRQSVAALLPTHGIISAETKFAFWDAKNVSQRIQEQFLLSATMSPCVPRASRTELARY